MGIIGNHPETGVRLEVTRPREGGPPWRYEGEAATSQERFGFEATVSAEGDVTVEVAHGVPEGVAERARLVLRAAWRHAAEDGLPPPRHIVRWRPDVDLAPARRGG